MTGAGNPAGGLLTTTSIIAAGYKLHIYRSVPVTQETQYQQNDAFPAKTTEKALDKLTMIAQQHAAGIGRALQVPVADINPTTMLPKANDRANRVLGFDNKGDVRAINMTIGSVTSPVVDNYAMLRLIEKASAQDAFVLGANTAGDGRGGGKYRQDETDTTSDESLPYIVVAADGARWKLTGAIATGMNISAQQLLSSEPFGSPLPTDASFICAGATQSENQQFMAQFEFVSNKGTNPLGGNVTLYTAIRGYANSGGIWAFNNVAIAEAGFPYQSSNIFGQELNINNWAGDYNEMGAANSIGLMMNGLGYRNTCAMLISTATGAPLWYYGLRFQPNTVQQSTIQDLSSSVVSLDIRGTHRYGVDLGNAPPFTGGGIRIGYDQTRGQVVKGIVSGQGDFAPQPVIGCDADGHVTLGGTAVGSHFVAGHLQPIVDNTYFCGSASYRWASLWSANGTIQTSDPSLKTDIDALPITLPLVLNLKPSTWKWIDGGVLPEVVDYDEEYQVTETVTADELVIEMRDGVPTQVTRQTTREVPVFDYVQVVDENGEPVFQTIPAANEVRDPRSGAVLAPAQEAKTIPLTHPVPRMATRKAKRTEFVSHAGKRTHWGFLAPDVKAAFEALGIDFAGYVLDSEGVQHLRPDQLIPVLWKAFQEAYADIDARLKKLEDGAGSLTPSAA
ncbi:hypothetical protein DPV74_18125 [Burkholderia sp. HAN2018]|nr:hypothetical protein [Burkholderia sp. HAN2018]